MTSWVNQSRPEHNKVAQRRTRHQSVHHIQDDKCSCLGATTPFLPLFLPQCSMVSEPYFLLDERIGSEGVELFEELDEEGVIGGDYQRCHNHRAVDQQKVLPDFNWRRPLDLVNF